MQAFEFHIAVEAPLQLAHYPGARAVIHITHLQRDEQDEPGKYAGGNAENVRPLAPPLSRYQEMLL